VQPNTLVTKILELAREDPNLLEQLEKFRRAITVMFTDIYGSTAYFEKFGDIAGLALVRECNDLLRGVIEKYGGRVLKTIGDAVMAVFDNCDESIRAAITIQRRLRQANAVRKKEDEMRVRIGLHHGIGIVKSDDVFGDVVNVASRVESIALPEQIVISDSLRRQISPAQFDIVFLGSFRLKGKSEDRDLFLVRWSDTESLNSAHTIVTRPDARDAKLQHLTRDGAVAAEYFITLQGLSVGSTEGDVKFPEDSTIRAVQARFSLEEGQPMVEDVSKKGSIFVRLIATYTLEQADIVAMGARLFKFVSKPDFVTAATLLGKTLSNVSELLNESAAKFVLVNRDGSEQQENYPLLQEEVSFGRINGTYTFSDDPLMSRSHARVYHRGEDFFLEDLRTRNGTFVKVRGKAPVPFEAPVLLGRQVFRIVR
jgi:class 3 adenylate cyclase